MADFKKGQNNGQNKNISNKSDDQKNVSHTEISRYFPQHKETQTPIKNNSVKNSKAAKCTGKCDCNCNSCNGCNPCK